MDSRVFYLSPKLHNSKPKTENLNLSAYAVNVQHPIDNRSGATVDNFNRLPVMNEIQNKINCDVTYFGGSRDGNKSPKNLTISTTVERYYPYVKGYMWSQCNTDVRLDMKATLNDSTIIHKEYQSAYASSGLDKEYEGSVITTIEQGANVTLGVSLRKTLDQFY
ncbi:MAG TPA: hypothetical protein DGG95_02120, partial [Cytophagales bacterium]|nr:hypothetical protein [Cytophagales bacterium]